MNKNITKKTIGELVNIFNYIRVPLSSVQRKDLDKIYPYYGAQGIVDYIDKYLFDGEYILVAEDGENLRSNNQNICNLINDKFWVNNHAHILQANDANSTKYLFYNFNRIKFEPYVTGSAQPKLNKENLLNIVTYVHDLKDQKKIASVLSALDDKIELNNKINIELEEMAKTLYDYWFVQFDFPFDFAPFDSAQVPITFDSAQGKRNENGTVAERSRGYKSSGGEMVYDAVLKREIPKDWEVKSLFQIANYINGLACQKFRPENETDHCLPVIKIREMNDGISKNTEKVRVDIPEKNIINDGDVLFSWSATLDVKIWTEGKAGLNQHIFKVTSDKYPRSFYYFETLNYLQHFKMMAELRKTTMGHITKDHLMESYIPIPPMELVTTLDNKLKPILEKIISNKKQNQELASLRDWLLPMLMNGQVRVGDSDGEGLGLVAESSMLYNRSNEKTPAWYDQRFELWISQQGLAARGNIDKATLRELFDAMNDEDK